MPLRQCVFAAHGDDRVERAADEVGELQLGDRPLAHPGRTEGGADEALLGDRRVDHAFVAELLEQSFRDAEGPPKWPTSSPIRKTRSSSRMASAIAARIASR